MVTSAMPRDRRAVEPLKMTSAISPPRRLLALCSPRIQRTASTMLDLPEPLGPTMAVTPSPNSKVVLSAKLLKPTRSRRLSMQPPRGGGAYQDSKWTGGRLDKLWAAVKWLWAASADQSQRKSKRKIRSRKRSKSKSKRKSRNSKRGQVRSFSCSFSCSYSCSYSYSLSFSYSLLALRPHAAAAAVGQPQILLHQEHLLLQLRMLLVAAGV